MLDVFGILSIMECCADDMRNEKYTYDEINRYLCLRISICGDNYSIAVIRINNGKIIFKGILEDEFDIVVNFLIRNHHLIECCKG